MLTGMWIGRSCVVSVSDVVGKGQRITISSGRETGRCAAHAILAAVDQHNDYTLCQVVWWRAAATAAKVLAT